MKQRCWIKNEEMSLVGVNFAILANLLDANVVIQLIEECTKRLICMSRQEQQPIWLLPWPIYEGNSRYACIQIEKLLKVSLDDISVPH